jgi:sec-independent protein translocase protein TatC
MSPETRDTEELAEGTLISHLLELRGRLLRSMIAILIVFLPLAMFSNDLFTIVAQPLIDKLPEGNSLIATSVVAPFMTPLKLALVASIFIAMPYVLYQVWAFIAPGLYRHEKRFALPLFASSVFLFYAGTAFAYFIVFPLMFKFLTMTTPVGVKMMTDISSYLDFVVLLFFAFGVAFETPVATVCAGRVGARQASRLSRRTAATYCSVSS